MGCAETDIVWCSSRKSGIENLAKGKLTLGAGASVAAGGQAAGRRRGRTDAEVYAYSRARTIRRHGARWLGHHDQRGRQRPGCRRANAAPARILVSCDQPSVNVRLF
jgi:hypothetical protein